MISLETGFTKLQYSDNGLPATFENNSSYVYMSYGASVNYELRDFLDLQLWVKRADAPFSYSYYHERNLSLYPSGSFVSRVSKSSRLSYTQVSILPVIHVVRRKEPSSFFLIPSLSTGISISFRSNENPNAGKFLTTSVNGNGDSFITEDSVYQLRETAFSIPIQIQVGSFINNKPFLKFSIWFNQGLSTLYEVDAVYTIINGPSYSNILRSKGTTLAIMLSYPIVLNTKKKN